MNPVTTQSSVKAISVPALINTVTTVSGIENSLLLSNSSTNTSELENSPPSLVAKIASHVSKATKILPLAPSGSLVAESLPLPSSSEVNVFENAPLIKEDSDNSFKLNASVYSITSTFDKTEPTVTDTAEPEDSQKTLTKFDLPLESKAILVILPFSLLAYCIVYFFGTYCEVTQSKVQFVETIYSMVKNNDSALNITSTIDKYLELVACSDSPQTWSIINFFALTMTSQVVALFTYIFQLTDLPTPISSYWGCICGTLFALPLAFIKKQSLVYIPIILQAVVLFLAIVMRVLKPCFSLWITLNLLVVYVIRYLWCYDEPSKCLNWSFVDESTLAAKLDIEYGVKQIAFKQASESTSSAKKYN